MKTLKIPFSSGVPVRLQNRKKQSFMIWCEPAYKPAEIFQSLNHRIKLLQKMVLVTKGSKSYDMLVDYNFDAELIKVEKDGRVSNISLLSAPSSQNPKQIIKIDGPGFYLLAHPGFATLYDLHPDDSLAHFGTKTDMPDIINQERIVISETHAASDIVEKILSQKDAAGLRSLIPSVYVWYHDLLFIVEKISFPNYCASRPMYPVVKHVVGLLKSNGIKPILREAVYRSVYFSNIAGITTLDTLWGMENQGYFVTTNLKKDS